MNRAWVLLLLHDTLHLVALKGNRFERRSPLESTQVIGMAVKQAIFEPTLKYE